jgi:hypothetical protein
MLTLQPSTFDWALAHVLRYRDTDVLPFPFEFRAIEHDWENVRKYLMAADVSSWAVRPHRTLIAPKARYGFRVVTQLDPLDFLVFASLVRDVAEDIEARRAPIGRGFVFSYRVKLAPNGQLFNADVGYEDFRRAADDALKDKTYTHVAVADIADFYHRIYAHRLENALNATTSKNGHVRAIMRMLSGWNGTETFGIPVGNQPSRVLAEAALIDVDEAMLAEGALFVRYNDDYRIFSRSHAEAYRRLAFLADVLYRNHGLTLQLQKTSVLTVTEFKERFQTSPVDRELDSLYERFQKLMNDLGLTNWYEEIDYEELDPDQKAVIDALNLAELFRDEVKKTAPDFATIRFVLRRLGQLGDPAVADDALDALEDVYPAFPAIVEYLSNLRDHDEGEYRRLGRRILDSIEKSIVSELEYHRMWGLDLFAGSTQWNHADRFFRMLGEARDQTSRRKLILAMGRARQRHWFQSQWRNLFNEAPWPKRAVIAAASCMPADARKHWYNSIESRLDTLELAVMRWAKANPFG